MAIIGTGYVNWRNCRILVRLGDEKKIEIYSPPISYSLKNRTGWVSVVHPEQEFLDAINSAFGTSYRAEEFEEEEDCDHTRGVDDHRQCIDCGEDRTEHLACQAEHERETREDR